jgi:hypothetical protein
LRASLLLTEKGIEAAARFTCPSRGISRTLHFLVDTGSGLSFLGWKDALQADIDPEKLPGYGKPVAGFGGAADARHLKEPCFIYLDFEGTLVQIELPEGVLVYRPSRKKTKHWTVQESISLFGRDALRSSGCRLVVDLPREEAYLERS